MKDLFISSHFSRLKILIIKSQENSCFSLEKKNTVNNIYYIQLLYSTLIITLSACTVKLQKYLTFQIDYFIFAFIFRKCFKSDFQIYWKRKNLKFETLI